MSKRFMVGERSLTAAKKIWPSGKEVTPDYLKINDEQFATLVKSKAIVPWQAKPEAKPAARGVATGGNPETDKKKDLPPVLRAGRILEVIKDLFKADGSRKSEDDFTQDNRPKTDALNSVFACIDDEPEISASERDDAWAAYEAEKAAKDAG